jgi:hypothetical protein
MLSAARAERSGNNMMKAVWSGVIASAVLSVGLFSTALQAQQQATASVTATATVAAKARLDLTGAVAFADADPETVTLINAAPINVTVKARTGATETVTLTVVADGDFVNAASDVIPIANLSWLAGGTGFVAGTASTSAVSVGSWTGSGTRNGTQTYRLVNSWTYAPGSYSVELTYTLTAP